jgi:hypothetical protein
MARDLDPSPVQEVEGLLGCEPEAVSLRPAIPALLVEDPSLRTEAHMHAIESGFHARTHGGVSLIISCEGRRIRRGGAGTRGTCRSSGTTEETLHSLFHYYGRWELYFERRFGILEEKEGIIEA